jgi:3-keto-disaccharide hydrolase
MWRLAAALLAVVIPARTVAPPVAPASIVGRWDITIAGADRSLPSWLEVRPSGNGYLVGQFVGVVGSARPIARVDFADGVMRFAIPPQWEQGKADLQVEGRVDGAGLRGTMTFPDGTRRDWTAVRAPSLRREKAPSWGAPIRLFNGKDLTGWHALGTNQWQAVNGVLTSPKSGANLVSDRTFTDYQLHLEFRYPKGSNSGVYQRGRYEVQIEDSVSTEPQNDMLGGVYGFIAPSEMMAKSPGEWQTYEITLVGRMITVVANGRTVICNREIPGITGGALDSNEGEPGPLLLQGDHGPIEYRNITLRPAR